VNLWAGLVVMMVSVGLLSAFMNNTPVVAIFMPIMLSVAAAIRVSPSKLLMRSRSLRCSAASAR